MESHHHPFFVLIAHIVMIHMLMVIITITTIITHHHHHHHHHRHRGSLLCHAWALLSLSDLMSPLAMTRARCNTLEKNLDQIKSALHS